MQSNQTLHMEEAERGLEQAGEEICLSKCAPMQTHWEIGKGIVELGRDEFDLHLKNHGYINATLAAIKAIKENG